MNLLQAAVLGATQGLTEFLPVSSSGHLVLVPWGFGWDEVLADEAFNKTFDVALHVGTVVGAAVYLRADLARLVSAGWRSLRTRSLGDREEEPERRLAWYVALSAIPAVLIGLLFRDLITERLGEPWQIGVLLAVFGVLLWAVDARAQQSVPLQEIDGRRASLIAMGQALALAPGVSRSGVTMTCGRALGLTRDAAARFSFLISLPVTTGAALYEGLRLLGQDDPFRGQGAAFAVGILASGITGALAVWGTLAFLRRFSLGAFAGYRLLVAAGVFLLIATNTRMASI